MQAALCHDALDVLYCADERCSADMHALDFSYWCCCNMQCHSRKFKGLAGYCLIIPGKAAVPALGLGLVGTGIFVIPLMMDWDKHALEMLYATVGVLMCPAPFCNLLL